MQTRITLNIPHSSIAGLQTAQWNDITRLNEAVNRWTDWHSDLLFKPKDDTLPVRSFIFDKNRFVVDVERLVDDPMETHGQGIVYEKFDGGLSRTVSSIEKEHLYTLREQYLSMISRYIVDNDRLGFNNILIDCHSFPSDLSDVDICIGFNTTNDCPPNALVEMITNHFESYGYKVGINEPYSNSIQPVDTNLTNSYSSVMIEINKRIYMNEDTLCLLDSATLVREVINSLYHKLIDTI